MKFVSWNVNGIRACVKKGFLEAFEDFDADVFCLQETKLQAGQIDLDLPGYEQYWHYAEKKGYSGTAIFTRIKPLSVRYGMDEHENEGRVLTLEYESFYLVNAYSPNAQRDLARLPYRLEWEDVFRQYLQSLDEQKPVILCGDLNVAHEAIDLKNPKSNQQNSGFTIEERDKMTTLLASGFVDTFRYLYPDRKDVYTWWSYMPKVRERNIGWRIDYFIVSERLASCIQDSQIYDQVLGSDHCPVVLLLDLNPFTKV